MLAADLIAARMEEHRARSGLFYDWDGLPGEDELGQLADPDAAYGEGGAAAYGVPGTGGLGDDEYGQGASLEEQQQYVAAATLDAGEEAAAPQG